MPDSVDQLAYDLAAMAQRLREIGEEGLVRELAKGIGKAVEPVPAAIRTGLRPHLPDRYADVLNEDLRTGRTTSTRGDVARVTVFATTRGLNGVQRRRLKRLDDGVLAHPLFGDRERWYYQPVEPGWFSGPAEDAIPRARDEIERALNEVGAQAAGKGVL